MAFFDNFTDSLRQKWLQFFQMNHGWITRHMEVESVYTPDGGRRPPSYLILGVVNALEPKLAQLMLPFSKLNPDADTLIEVLELNFDPDLVLGNRINPQAELESQSDVLIGVSDAVALDEDTIGVVVTLEPDEFNDALLETNLDGLDAAVPEAGGMSLHDFSDEMALEQFDDDESLVVLHAAEAQAFGDLSFDEEVTHVTGLGEASPHESLETLGTMHPAQMQELGDVLPDVWNEEELNRMSEAHEGTHPKTPEGEDTLSLLEDEEISRLFPNF